MHNKLKNTLTGLFVALGMLTLSYTASQAPRHEATLATVATTTSLTVLQDAPARKRVSMRKSGMVMPYFSFAPFLPKQES